MEVMASTTAAAQIVWEFQARPECSSEFELRYGPQGDWVRLFRQSPGFRETILSHAMEVPYHYLVTDIWNDLSFYHDFQQRSRKEYEALDNECKALTLSERRIGIFGHQ